MAEDKVEIWASLGITKNLGNYESLRLDAGAKTMAVSLEDEGAWKKLWDAIDMQIEAKLKELDDGTSK
jgi:hypothetical protein